MKNKPKYKIGDKVEFNAYRLLYMDTFDNSPTIGEEWREGGVVAKVSKYKNSYIYDMQDDISGNWLLNDWEEDNLRIAVQNK